MAKYSKKETQEAIDELREMLKPGDRVYTVLRHRSASGMSRSIDLFIVRENQLARITWLIARALGDTIDQNHGGIKVAGCGMDAGFEVVYNLGRVLFPQGFDLPEGAYGRNGDTSGHDTDGGYALKQEWL